ncbi:MAG TPA: hypothetical protein VF008_01020 [Niastella sp.]
MKKKLALNFKETRDSDLYGLASTVVQKMTDNEYFPDPGMLIIELWEINNQFKGAMVDAGLKDREKIAYKNNVKVSLIKKLKQVGEFVLLESKGAELPMVSSGFSLYKPVDEIILKKPAQFRITPGKNPGEIIMQVRRVKGARSYLYQWTPFPITTESVWESVVDTRCKKVISKLPLGVQYCFRMAAVGAHKQILYTEPLYRYIS